MAYVEPSNIYNHIQIVIYTNNLQFILTDYIFYLDQPLHHSISFEYVIIVWHCGELWDFHNNLMTTTPLSELEFQGIVSPNPTTG